MINNRLNIFNMPDLIIKQILMNGKLYINFLLDMPIKLNGG